MMDRSALHALVDRLPEDAIDNAEHALQHLVDADYADPDTEARILEARANVEAGRVVPEDEVKAATRRLLDQYRPR